MYVPSQPGQLRINWRSPTRGQLANQSADGTTWTAGYDDGAHPARRQAFWFKRWASRKREVGSVSALPARLSKLQQ